MIEINESNFAEQTSNGLVLVDFYADWCGPCKMLTPVLKQLTDVKVVKVDVDKCPDLAMEHSVSAIPKLVFMKDGKVVDQLTGLSTKEKLQKRIDELK